MSDRRALSESEQLARIAPMLNSLEFRGDATCSYEIMSDALVWSDEIPGEAHSQPEKYWVLRILLRFRTTVILVAPSSTYEGLWSQAFEACPQWPGLHPDRRKRDLEAVYRQKSWPNE